MIVNLIKSLRSNFPPNFKFKICQEFKIIQPKVINYQLFGDLCLINFKSLSDLNKKSGEKLLINVFDTKYDSITSFITFPSYDIVKALF